MKNAFTLIELSIVLIIIGLLVGGIVTGSSLIESAKLHKISTQFRQFETALLTFQLTYDQKPGDFDQASSFWGSTNGDGNNKIDSTAEGARTWEHLSLAGMIGGGHVATGTSNADRFNFGAGQTAPEGPFDTSGYTMGTTSIPVFGGAGDVIQFLTSEGASWDSILTPEQAQQFDTMIDDSNATTGRILGTNGSTVNGSGSTADNCNDAVLVGGTDSKNTANSGDYLLSNSAVACRLVFVIGG